MMLSVSWSEFETFTLVRYCTRHWVAQKKQVRATYVSTEYRRQERTAFKKKKNRLSAEVCLNDLCLQRKPCEKVSERETFGLEIKKQNGIKTRSQRKPMSCITNLRRQQDIQPSF